MRYLLTADRVLEGQELKEIKNGAVVAEDEWFCTIYRISAEQQS